MLKPARLAVFALLGFAAGLLILYLGARGTTISPPAQCLIGGAIPGGFFLYYRWVDARKSIKALPEAPRPRSATGHRKPQSQKKPRKKRKN